MKCYRRIRMGTFTALLIVALMSVAACGGRSSISDNQFQAQSAKGSTMDGVDKPQNVSAHLEQLALGVPGVKGANCVVFGKYAIVGIDVDEKMERSEVGTLKYSVAEAFLKDPYGVDAIVTADIDLAQRLREIKVDINNGHALTGFANELADIMGRIIPQMPRNIIPPKTPEDVGNQTLNNVQKQAKTPSAS
ncbi:MAG: YhcN/YlaJ family sporulation lipoprotein [Candidatus Cohnella colombiensis]|uniref:YhcN/YlaJ family sporulation lipoprotein n=1 Tax=Candidatus Cohnella colombiensis TaxID=3121368 RepID=A0AA95JEV0_9BACL|nr:MAG: YhcN/YlaJ family sporulation lipoprotein [Cohnella sp.]